MLTKNILVASSCEHEAITKWIINNKSLTSQCDVIFTHELLCQYEIYDELDDEAVNIIWKDPASEKVYTNQSHVLLNRIIYIDSQLFKNFKIDDCEYAKREFEAYLGFAMNSFQSPQKASINGTCEKIYSLPQQWQMVRDATLGINVPQYIWSGVQINLDAAENEIVKTGIFNFLNWSSNESNESGFQFIKPKGDPVFVFVLGTELLITTEIILTNTQREKLSTLISNLMKLFDYFICEVLLFVDFAQNAINFGCVNTEIIRSSNNSQFNDFLKNNFLKEYAKCLY